MDVHHQTIAGSFAPIDTERASIAMRLVMMCGEFIKAGEQVLRCSLPKLDRTAVPARCA